MSKKDENNQGVFFLPFFLYHSEFERYIFQIEALKDGKESSIPDLHYSFDQSEIKLCHV